MFTQEYVDWFFFRERQREGERERDGEKKEAEGERCVASNGDKPTI